MVPSNPKFFDIVGAFREQDEISNYGIVTVRCTHSMPQKLISGIEERTKKS